MIGYLSPVEFERKMRPAYPLPEVLLPMLLAVLAGAGRPVRSSFWPLRKRDAYEVTQASDDHTHQHFIE
jgi:hypothetical protein